MKILAGALGAVALLLAGPIASAQVTHQKTGTAYHPGGHSWNNGHRNSGKGVPVYGYQGSGGGSHVHHAGCGHSCSSCKPKPQPVARCFPPGHCKSINSNPRYYGPPGQKGR